MSEKLNWCDSIENRIEAIENLLLNRQAPDKLSIDSDIQDLLYYYFCSKIAETEPQKIAQIKESIKQLVKVLNSELLLHLVYTLNGLPIEISMHNLGMQSDIPG